MIVGNPVAWGFVFLDFRESRGVLYFVVLGSPWDLYLAISDTPWGFVSVCVFGTRRLFVCEISGAQ